MPTCTMATSLQRTDAKNWLLPDGVADVLFKDAQKQESLRDALLFVLTANGYRLVAPPLIEYTETLILVLTIVPSFLASVTACPSLNSPR